MGETSQGPKARLHSCTSSQKYSTMEGMQTLLDIQRFGAKKLRMQGTE